MTKKHPKPRPDKPGRQFGDPSHSSGQEKRVHDSPVLYLSLKVTIIAVVCV